MLIRYWFGIVYSWVISAGATARQMEFAGLLAAWNDDMSPPPLDKGKGVQIPLEQNKRRAARVKFCTDVANCAGKLHRELENNRSTMEWNWETSTVSSR